MSSRFAWTTPDETLVFERPADVQHFARVQGWDETEEEARLAFEYGVERWLHDNPQYRRVAHWVRALGFDVRRLDYRALATIPGNLIERRPHKRAAGEDDEL